MLAHCNLKQNAWLCSKQSSFFSFYALPSGGKLKDTVVHSCFVTDDLITNEVVLIILLSHIIVSIYNLLDLNLCFKKV